MIAGLKLQDDAFVSCDSARIRRALIIYGNRSPADLIDPASRTESTKMNGFGTRDQEQVKDAIGAREAGRVKRCLGGTGESETENQGGTRNGECQQIFPNH